LIPEESIHVTGFSCNELCRELIIWANGEVLPCCDFMGIGFLWPMLRKHQVVGSFLLRFVKNTLVQAN